MRSTAILLTLMLVLFSAPVYASDPAPGDTILPINLLGIAASATTSAVVLWDGTVSVQFPAAAAIMKVASTDADDDDADTGARTIVIMGLNASYQKIYETVTLNGQTIVSTTKSYLRVNEVHVVTAGSSAANEGIISIFTGTATSGVPDDSTKLYSSIAAGMGRSISTQFTTGLQQYVMFQRIHFNVKSGETATFRIWMRPIGGAATLVGYKHVTGGSFSYLNDLSLILYPKTDMWCDVANSTTAAVTPSAELSGVYYDSTEMPFFFPKH